MIEERKATIGNLLEEVKTHPMCARFSEDKWVYVVFFPPGFSLDGMRGTKKDGKAKILQVMIDKMERIWKEEWKGFQ